MAASGRRIIVPDPILGPIVTRLYIWFASGEYSLKRLAQRAFAEGFRFRVSRNKVPVTTLHKILRRRIYMGEFEDGGKTYQGIHEPLIDRVTWEQCRRFSMAGMRKNTARSSTILLFRVRSPVATAVVPW